jgi:exopolysaccharide biosynthesis protein
MTRARVLLIPALLLSFQAPLPAAASPPSTTALPSVAQSLIDQQAVIETDKDVRPVAPGVTLTSFDRVDGAGWLRADALSASLSGGASVDYLYSGAVSTPEPLSGPASRSRAVAAVNGDFFDINNSSAAQGIGIQSGQLIQSPVQGHHLSAGITPDGVGKVLEIYFEGTATPSSGTSVSLTQFNNLIQPGGAGAFTSLWGDYARSRAVAGSGRVTEVVVTAGVVTSVSSTAGAGPIPSGTTVLLGREAGADQLAALTVGTAVEVAYRPKPSGDVALKAAIGGNHVLVRDGVPQQIADASLAPRTAVGFSADGRTMHLLTVDGRQVDSRGVTLTELGQMMAELGAQHALNLDGGGSSTLLAREPGSAQVQVENQPSDGGERSVPNGLAIYAPQGSGTLTGFWVETAIDPRDAAGIGPVRGGRPDRVFPGLTRRLTAAGFDETYGPAAGTPRWRSSGLAHGFVSGNVFRALVPGETTVTAYQGAASGSLGLTVLGPLDRVEPTQQKLGLSGLDGSATFGLVGYDREGHGAPIEPDDIELSYDTSLFSVTGENGLLKVRALQPVGAGLVTMRAGGKSAVIGVTAGLESVVIADFENAPQWFYNAVPADIPGSVSAVTGQVGTGLRLSADFARHSVTRAAYANPPQFIDVPGQPQGFSMWINGTGKGEWASLHLVDANGSAVVLRGGNVTWTGWQQVNFVVPQGVAYPVKVRRFYAPEIKADARYQSELIIDELAALLPPSLEVPEAPAETDRFVIQDGTADGSPWRFAVMSDSQFVAANPDSDLVAQARRTLREIRAAAPDFVIINGDFVDTAFPADFALAKRILDEELAGQLPYYYIPGNHEIMGAPISNFQAAFGQVNRVLDHKGTRFVMLNSADGSLHVSQLGLLRQALDGAAGDAAIKSVAVLHHHPPRDPTPAKASQLGDRKEAALIEQWLGEFPKQAYFVGAHVGTFHASRIDGVPYLINGNSGKGPSTPADEGGFTGWTHFGVTAGEITAETRAHVDSLAITASATAPVLASVPVSATVTQLGRVVPVALPVSADWSGSANVHVGPAYGLRPWHHAWFDPAAGNLLVLRSTGSVTLTVTVNGSTASTVISLTR